MSRLGSVLGNEYQNNKLSIVTRNVRVGDATFKVRIPTVGEQEEINKRIVELDEKKIQEVYEERTAKLMEVKEQNPPDVEYLEDDILLKGKSIRETVRTQLAIQARVMETIKLIIPQEGQDWSEITYADIEAEWAWEVQLEVVKKILEAINPEYKEIKEK